MGKEIGQEMIDFSSSDEGSLDKSGMVAARNDQTSQITDCVLKSWSRLHWRRKRRNRVERIALYYGRDVGRSIEVEVEIGGFEEGGNGNRVQGRVNIEGDSRKLTYMLEIVEVKMREG